MTVSRSSGVPNVIDPKSASTAAQNACSALRTDVIARLATPGLCARQSRVSLVLKFSQMQVRKCRTEMVGPGYCVGMAWRFIIT